MELGMLGAVVDKRKNTNREKCIFCKQENKKGGERIERYKKLVLF